MVRLNIGVNGYDVATMARQVPALSKVIRMNSLVNGAHSGVELR
jgi:hypothetical protein